MPSPSLTVAILAGGAATRLGGRDKGLEPLVDRSLVGWVIDAVSGMDAFQPTASRGRVGISRDMSRADGGLHTEVQIGLAGTRMCEGLGGDRVESQNDDALAASRLLIVANRHLDDYAKYAHTIPDTIPGYRGPLAGIAAALADCTTPWLLTIPVDCPAPPSDLAARFLAAAHTHDGDAFVAHDGERRQPLFALYRRELAASAVAGVAVGQGVWQWQEAIGARELDFGDRRAQFRNLNTPEDFAAYAAEHRLAQ